VDSTTGEVGSAGASCIAGSIIISDIHPGIGVIHTQAQWNQENQNNAFEFMEVGVAPQEIINWLVENDVQNNPTVRQYGIVDLVDNGRSAGFTGINCYDYKDHILGQTYAIQGNILLGPEILDDMEFAFNNTYGSLDEKLMATLLAANVPGADIRCLNYGTPALSAFIRVAKPDNSINEFFLDLNVNSVPSSMSPIDSLYTNYWDWKSSQYILGDLNYDRSIDVIDIHLMSQFINGDEIPTDIQINPADINNNGEIELTDLYLLLYAIIGIVGNN
jgi:uncharacterized Ntn-hydrolase superfamily protein